jgi:RNA polymerase sigma factor (sigma-70 family)
MTDDATLVKRALAGDQRAFDVLYARHLPTALRVAAAKVGKADAEEVAQIAMTNALTKLASFSGASTFEAWLVRITQNAAFSELRKRKNRRETTVEDIDGAADDFLMHGADGHAYSGESEQAEEEIEQPAEVPTNRTNALRYQLIFLVLRRSCSCPRSHGRKQL